MNVEKVGLICLVILVSGCTSLPGSSSGTPTVSGENTTVSQGSDSTVEIKGSNVLVIGVADPNQVIDKPDSSMISPEPQKVMPNYNDKNANSHRIGWLIQWSKAVNATAQLPVNSSKEPGSYSYSLIGTGVGQPDTVELEVNITG